MNILSQIALPLLIVSCDKLFSVINKICLIANRICAHNLITCHKRILMNCTAETDCCSLESDSLHYTIRIRVRSFYARTANTKTHVQ